MTLTSVPTAGRGIGVTVTLESWVPGREAWTIDAAAAASSAGAVPAVTVTTVTRSKLPRAASPGARLWPPMTVWPTSSTPAHTRSAWPVGVMTVSLMLSWGRLADQSVPWNGNHISPGTTASGRWAKAGPHPITK